MEKHIRVRIEEYPEIAAVVFGRHSTSGVKPDYAPAFPGSAGGTFDFEQFESSRLYGWGGYRVGRALAELRQRGIGHVAINDAGTIISEAYEQDGVHRRTA